MLSHKLTATEAADIIERFLTGASLYPQEWNDFVDSKRGDSDVEVYRRRCNELDPLVNSAAPQDEEAIAELKDMVVQLRSIAAKG